MWRQLLACGLWLGAVAAHADAMTYDAAKTHADRDEAALSPQQLQALTDSQGRAAGEIFATCLPASLGQPQADFTVVMMLDATGRVVRTWRSGESAIAVCFEREMARKQLFEPPAAPFYSSFEMHWTDES